MSGQYTSGPWSADFHNEVRQGGRFITYVRGGAQIVPIAAVPTGVEGYGRDEGRANARLIAAAPELLEALQRIGSLVGEIENRPLTAVHNIADAYRLYGTEAIAKAGAQ